MSTYHVSGTVLNLYMCYSTKSLQPPFETYYYYCLHFKDLEIEAQQSNHLPDIVHTVSDRAQNQTQV